MIGLFLLSAFVYGCWDQKRLCDREDARYERFMAEVYPILRQERQIRDAARIAVREMEVDFL